MTLSFWHWELNLGVLFKSLYEKVKSFASFASCLSPVRFKTKKKKKIKTKCLFSPVCHSRDFKLGSEAAVTASFLP